jgi:hypothetical protein
MMAMNMTAILTAGAIGLGATLLIDLWGFVLERAFGIASLDVCLLGRWALHIPRGRIRHERIVTAGHMRHECRVGWTMHYLIGVAFAVAFVILASPAWLARPTLVPALLFGVATVLVPFFTIQPAFGLGIASSKTANPVRARLKSVSTHTVFGVGLWLFASLFAA